MIDRYESSSKAVIIFSHSHSYSSFSRGGFCCCCCCVCWWKEPKIEYEQKGKITTLRQDKNGNLKSSIIPTWFEIPARVCSGSNTLFKRAVCLFLSLSLSLLCVCICVLLLLQPRETETESVLSTLACRVTLRNPIGLCVMRCSCCILIRPLNIWTVSLSRLATVARPTKNMEEFLPSEHSTRARAMFSCMTPSPSTSPFSSNSCIFCVCARNRARARTVNLFLNGNLCLLSFSLLFLFLLLFFYLFSLFSSKKKGSRRISRLNCTWTFQTKKKKKNKTDPGKR